MKIETKEKIKTLSNQIYHIGEDLEVLSEEISEEWEDSDECTKGIKFEDSSFYEIYDYLCEVAEYLESYSDEIDELLNKQTE